MKTERDLKLMARDEIGWAPNTEEYIQFLEEHLLVELNRFKSSFERQVEALDKKKSPVVTSGPSE